MKKVRACSLLGAMMEGKNEMELVYLLIKTNRYAWLVLLKMVC